MILILFVLSIVSPDAIHQHVKTKNVPTTTLHYKAPEYAGRTVYINIIIGMSR